jgi:hypothetical protein
VSDLLDLRTVNDAWHVGPCAEVRVGEHVTRYVRRGSGPSVVLLGAETESSPTWRSLVEWLGPNYRMTIPQVPSDGIDPTEWLRGFIEGLGLTAFVLFAAPELRAAALDLTLADDFTVQKLVLLADLEDHAGESSARVLWMSPGWSPTDALGRVETFLSTEEYR